MDAYDSWIETYMIQPSIGRKYSWGAKAHVKKAGTGRIDDAIALSEHWGETKDEAYTKAEAEACDWIAKRQS